jgi:hypothetical protein
VLLAAALNEVYTNLYTSLHSNEQTFVSVFTSEKFDALWSLNEQLKAVYNDINKLLPVRRNEIVCQHV